MDTNLKKSNYIRAFLARLIMAASLITMLAIGIFGREALINLAKVGSSTLTGDVYYLLDFREYMADIFHNYIIANAGVADETGFPITDASAQNYQTECNDTFQKALKLRGNSVVYHYQRFHEDNDTLVMDQMANIDVPLYSESDGHLLEVEEFRRTIYWDGLNSQLYFFDEIYEMPVARAYLPKTDYTPALEAASHMRFVLGYKDNGYSIIKDYQTLAKEYQMILLFFFGSLALFIITGLIALFTRKSFAAACQGYRRLSIKLLPELKLLILAVAIFYLLSNHLHYTSAELIIRRSIFPKLWLYYPITAIIYLLWLDLRIAPTEGFKHTLIYKSIQVIKAWDTSLPWKSKMQRAWLILILGCIANVLSIITLLLTFGILGNLAFTVIIVLLCLLFLGQCVALSRLYHFIQDTDVLLSPLDSMVQGKSIGEIHLSPHTLLEDSANTIRDLENGIKNAVAQENKANRMKVELITNVSHDLKTPLTSIINYADLLSEAQLEAPAGEYVEALRSKAYRLKKMVQDVFEISKASTGNLPVNLNKLDLGKLVNQTLADMDEELQKSTLQFKLHITSHPLLIMADGEKMYRVFQNLLVNAMQYSMDGSRVYISLEKQDSFAVAQVKNVSKEELNFDTEEIVERFVRADSSRTKEGSGLGLSIAQSFTQACGGEFSVQTDADLFTATIRFPLIMESPPE